MALNDIMFTFAYDGHYLVNAIMSINGKIFNGEMYKNNRMHFNVSGMGKLSGCYIANMDLEEPFKIIITKINSITNEEYVIHKANYDIDIQKVRH